MKKIVKLTERDLTRLVKKVIKEDEDIKMDYIYQMDDTMAMFSKEILGVIEHYEIKIEEIMFEADGDEMLEGYEFEDIQQEYEGYVDFLDDVKRGLKKML